MMSASRIGQPRSRNIAATVLLPEPMPPVRPTRNIAAAQWNVYLAAQKTNVHEFLNLLLNFDISHIYAPKFITNTKYNGEEEATFIVMNCGCRRRKL